MKLTRYLTLANMLRAFTAFLALFAASGVRAVNPVRREGDLTLVPLDHNNSTITPLDIHTFTVPKSNPIVSVTPPAISTKSKKSTAALWGELDFLQASMDIVDRNHAAKDKAIKIIKQSFELLALGSVANLLKVARYLHTLTAHAELFEQTRPNTYENLVAACERFDKEIEKYFTQPTPDNEELSNLVDLWFTIHLRMNGVLATRHYLQSIAQRTPTILKPMQWYLNVEVLSRVTDFSMPLQLQDGRYHSNLFFYFLKRSARETINDYASTNPNLSPLFQQASYYIKMVERLMHQQADFIKLISPNIFTQRPTLKIGEFIQSLAECHLYKLLETHGDYLEYPHRIKREWAKDREPNLIIYALPLAEAAIYGVEWLDEVNPLVEENIETMVAIRRKAFELFPAGNGVDLKSKAFYMEALQQEVTKEIQRLNRRFDGNFALLFHLMEFIKKEGLINVIRLLWNAILQSPGTSLLYGAILGALGLFISAVYSFVSYTHSQVVRRYGRRDVPPRAAPPQLIVRKNESIAIKRDIAGDLAQLADLTPRRAELIVLWEEITKHVEHINGLMKTAEKKIALVSFDSPREVNEVANSVIQQIKMAERTAKKIVDKLQTMTNFFEDKFVEKRQKLTALQLVADEIGTPLVAMQLAGIEEQEHFTTNLRQQTREVFHTITDINSNVRDFEASLQKQLIPPPALNKVLLQSLRTINAKLAEQVYHEIKNLFKEEIKKRRHKEWNKEPGEKQAAIIVFVNSNINKKFNLEAQLIAAIDQQKITHASQLPQWLAWHYMQDNMPNELVDNVDFRVVVAPIPSLIQPEVRNLTENSIPQSVIDEVKPVEPESTAVTSVSSAITHEPIAEDIKSAEITVVFPHPHADVIRQLFQDIKEPIYWIDEAIQLLDDGLASQSLFDDITQNLTIKAAQDNMIYQIILFNEKCKELENIPGGKQLVDGLITNRRQLIAVRNYLAHEPDKIKYDWIFDSDLLHCAQEVAQLKTTSLKWKAINSQWQPTLMLEDAPGTMNTDGLLQRFVRSSKDKQAQPSDEEFLDNTLQTIERYLQEIQRIHEHLNKNNLPLREQVTFQKKHIQFERALSFKMACYAEKDPQDMISNGMQFRHKLFHDPKQLHPQEIEKIQGQFVQLITARDIAGSSAIMKVAAVL